MMTAKRLLPILGLLLASGVIYTTGLHEYLTFETIRDNRAALTGFVAGRPYVSALIFLLIYVAVVALSIPGSAIMTLAGGFLFGWQEATILVVVAATAGASVLFAIARTALAGPFRDRAGPFLSRMQDGFRRNPFSYILFLRLVPIFPFWAVNLVPALLNVPFRSFVAATAIGIVPGTAVYAAFGTGLGGVFDSGSEVDLSGAFSPTMIAALIGLGLLALLPAILRAFGLRSK